MNEAQTYCGHTVQYTVNLTSKEIYLVYCTFVLLLCRASPSWQWIQGALLQTSMRDCRQWWMSSGASNLWGSVCPSVRPSIRVCNIVHFCMFVIRCVYVFAAQICGYSLMCVCVVCACVCVCMCVLCVWCVRVVCVCACVCGVCVRMCVCMSVVCVCVCVCMSVFVPHKTNQNETFSSSHSTQSDMITVPWPYEHASHRRTHTHTQHVQ